MTLAELKKQDLWKHFLELEQIPRESGNEEGVRRWLLAWAKEHGFEAIGDDAGNVIIRAKATPGYENAPSVALQGHMDMVCVKREGSTHDFTKDPIDVEVDGDWLCARDTSLGGDDGISIAIALTILTDPKAQHGPIECIFTKSEETGMDGANGIEGKNIRSRLLVNLDSEDEGILYIGCAGGMHTTGTMKVRWEAVPLDWKGYKLTVSGLLGGHSGGEIHKQRANAMKLAARLLVKRGHLMLSDWEGGTKMNVIPSSTVVTFAIPESDAAGLEQDLKKLSSDLKEEYALNDPGITLTLQEVDLPVKAAFEKQSKQFVRAMFLAPHGVYAMSETLKGIVETSSNLAIVSMADGIFSVKASHRSSVASRKHLVSDLMAETLKEAGMEVVQDAEYPSWTPDPKSALAKKAAQAYKDYTGKDMVVTAIHAGLECGIINSKVPGMDSVSCGPQMRAIHSVDEHLSISSSERTLGFVKHLLATLK